MDKNPILLRTEQLETVLRISQAVSRTLNLEEILQMASQMTTQALKADRCSIGLLVSEETYQIVHTYRKKHAYPSIDGVKYDLKKFPHIATPLLKRKVVHLLSHKKISLSNKERKLFRHLNMKVFLAVPITVDKEPLGAFHLGRVENSYPFTSTDIYLCQTIANQVGIAIKNATLLSDLKERFNQQNIILDISKSLFKTLNLQELFDQITQKTCLALKMDRCSLSTIEPDRKKAVIRSIHVSRRAKSLVKGKSEPFHMGKRYALADSTYIYRLLRRKKIFVTENILSLPLPTFVRKYARSVGTKSVLIVSLNPKRKMPGILALSSVERYHKFTDSEIKLCQTIANLASLAMENAKLMQDLQEKSIKIQEQTGALKKQFQEQKILLDISRALSQTMEIKKLFEIVVKKTSDLLGIDRCAVILLDEVKENLTFHKIYSGSKHRPEYEGFQRKFEDYPKLIKQLKKTHIFYTLDVSGSGLSAKEKKLFEKDGIKSLLIIPFFLAKKVQGLLALSTLKEHHNFTQSEIGLTQAIANQLSVAIENARLLHELKEKSEKIQKQTVDLKKKFQEENALLDISKALSHTLDLKKLFKIVTRKTAELLGIERCAAMLIDENKKSILLYTAFSRGRHESESEGVPRRVEDFPTMMNQVEKKHIFCTSDISQSELSSKEKSYFKKRGVKAVLNVPFVLKNRILGILALNPLKEQRKFTDSEIRLCQAIANQLSMAIENARLMELTKNHAKELEKLTLKIINAQEEERKSIAGKLHDVVAQDLTALQFDLKMSQQSLPEGCPQLEERLKESEELVKQSLEDLRNLTSDLRPQVLDHFGLPSAIQSYVDDYRRRTNLKIDLKLPKADCKFPPEFETTVYRIIQEGLTNVAKHSKATKVSISMQKKVGFARIIIKDNGIGFDVKSSYHSGGFGLFRLKENTGLLGGKFKINSKKGRGTKLDITLPC